jgi:hypothetical protein
MREQGIRIKETRSGCVSKDTGFNEQAAENIKMYMDAPENHIVIALDEKPGVQNIERLNGYVRNSGGQLVGA